MPQQKIFTADPTNPTEVEGLFGLALDLAMDGWGASIRANQEEALLQTNAPMNIIEQYLPKQSV